MGFSSSVEPKISPNPSSGISTQELKQEGPENIDDLGPKAPYEILCSEKTLNLAENYLQKLRGNNGETNAGNFLKKLLSEGVPASAKDLIVMLARTKLSLIFAESDKRAITEWTPEEVAILDGVILAGTEPNKVSGDGARGFARKWITSENTCYVSETTPVFISGALGKGPLFYTQDYKVALGLGELGDISKNLRPKLEVSLLHINRTAPSDGAFVMLPGIGCGEFAGEFINQMPGVFAKTLNEILLDRPERFSNIKAVCYDTYTSEEHENAEKEISGANARSDKLHVVNGEKMSVLHMKPSELGRINSIDTLKKLDGCKMYRGVAADLLSLPGNDVHQGGYGANGTDEGSYHGSVPEAVKKDVVWAVSQGQKEKLSEIEECFYDREAHLFHYGSKKLSYKSLMDELKCEAHVLSGCTVSVLDCSHKSSLGISPTVNSV